MTGDFEKRFKKVLSKKLVKIAHIARFMLRCGTKWERFTLAPDFNVVWGRALSGQIAISSTGRYPNKDGRYLRHCSDMAYLI